MTLLGKAIVAIWNDILPEGRENFVEWHNREHIPERIAIPGFLRGRRYIAEIGSPEYFTLYEATDTAVLTGQAYLERLNNPTPWTRQSTADFRNTVRGVCQIRHSEGGGDGGFIATLRFDADSSRRADLERMIVAHLETIGDLKGVSGVHLCIADISASGIETSERKGREIGVPNWIIMIEGSSMAAVDQAARALLDVFPDRGQIEPIEKGIYCLEFSLVDFSATPIDVERKLS